ncbi:MAG: PEP-CTERM sorting domain-containing protein [Capsulimonadales bacterium]|nr:PEP-CTERM sorting domain-containing protein [Capsulimonadales bacterium]
MRRWFSLAALVVALGGLTARPAHALNALELLKNGDFELGNLFAWRRSIEPGSFGGWVLDTPGTDLPGGIFANQFYTAANTLPGGGGDHYAAVTPPTGSEGFPGAYALYQYFTVPHGFVDRVTLRFQMFVADYAGFGPIVSPSAPPDELFSFFDPFDPNQFGRVDLLNVDAAPFSTAATDVRRNLYIGTEFSSSVSDPAPYIQYTIDITNFVSPGGRYMLRFAQVQSVSVLAMGVDNVSVISNGQANSPEPSVIALFLSGAVGGGFLLRRRRMPRL